MSYISTADAAVIRTQVTSASPRTITVGRLRGALPVGPALEVVLFLATSAVVTLFTCTGIAGMLLH